MAESNFVDYVKIYCRSGKGGRGSAHMRRAKYVPNGGPDGGNGGVRFLLRIKKGKAEPGNISIGSRRNEGALP